MQPIEFFDSCIFSKIPLFKTIFNPFQSLRMGRVEKQQGGNQIFFAVNLSLSQNGNCEYIYGYNNQFLDVISCIKNYRYRFILPISATKLKDNHEKHQKIFVKKQRNFPNMFQIRNRLLIILFQNHVYVHDLVRHYNRLTLGALSSKQFIDGWQDCLCKVGVCSFDANQHYVYRIYSNYLAMPRINIQLYNIEMSDNLNVKLVFNRTIKVTSGSGKVVNLSSSQNNNRLAFCVLYEQNKNQTLRLFIYTLQKWSSAESLNDGFKIKQVEIDKQLISICSFTGSLHEYNDCQQKQPNIPNISNNHYGTEICLVNANEQNLYLLYSPRQSQFLIIFSQLNQFSQNSEIKTIIIEHSTSIMKMSFSNDKIIVLDENWCLWKYNDYHQQPFLLVNLSAINQNTEQQTKYQIVATNNRIDIVSSNLKLYLLYPQMVFPKIFAQTQNQNNEHIQIKNCSQNNKSIPPFLSIQSQNFSNVDHLLVSDPKKSEIIQKFGCYLIISTHEPSVDVREEILCFSLEQIKKNIQIIECSVIKLHEIWSICQAILKKLSRIKCWLLGTKHDCEWNNHFWLLSQLLQNQRLKQDLRVVMENLWESQNVEGWEILETVFSSFKFQSYLVSRCQGRSYSVSCTTHFSKCRLLSGCSCPFKRLLFYLIPPNQFKTRQQLNLFFQNYSQYHQIMKIILYSEGKSSEEGTEKWGEKIQSLANQREKKVELEIKKKLQKMDHKIDKKWEKEFQEQLNQCSNTKEQIDESYLFTLPLINTYHEVPQITYAKTDQQLDCLYTKLPSSIVEQILNLKSISQKKTNYNQIYFQQVYNICQQNKLLFSLSKDEEKKIGKQEKMKLCIIVAKQLYGRFILELETKKLKNKEKQAGFDENEQIQGNISQKDYPILIVQKIHKSNFNRKYWILITQLICQALSIKYCEITSKLPKSKKIHQYLKYVLTFTNKSIISSKYLVHLPNCLKNIINLNVLPQAQLTCLIECIIQTQMHKFSDYSPEKSIKNYKFRYNQQVWNKGIEKLMKLKINDQENYQYAKEKNGYDNSLYFSSILVK